jgi:hypothetical protein
MAEKKASLTVLGGPLAGTRFVLEGVGPEVLLGADPSCHFQLALAGVSPHHARIHADDTGYAIEDAGSAEGLHVNDSRVTAATPLRNGDIIWLGTPGEADVVMLQCIRPARPAAPPPPPPSLSDDETLALALEQSEGATARTEIIEEEPATAFYTADEAAAASASYAADAAPEEAAPFASGAEGELVVAEDATVAESAPFEVDQPPPASAAESVSFEDDTREQTFEFEGDSSTVVMAGPEAGGPAPVYSADTGFMEEGPTVVMPSEPEPTVAIPTSAPPPPPRVPEPPKTEFIPKAPAAAPAPPPPPAPKPRAAAPSPPAAAPTPPATPRPRPAAAPAAAPARRPVTRSAPRIEAHEEPRAARSSAPVGLYAGLGILVVAVAGGGFWAYRHFTGSPPPTTLAEAPPTAVAAAPPRATPTPPVAETPVEVPVEIQPEPPPPPEPTPMAVATPPPAPPTTTLKAAPTPLPTPTLAAKKAAPTPTPAATPAGPSPEQLRAQQVANLLGQADSALAAGQYDQAIGHLDDVLRLDPGNAKATADRASAVSRRDAAKKKFVPGRTVVRTEKASGGGLAGFEGAEVQRTPDFSGRIEFEMSPSSGLKPGDPWTLRFYLVNDGRKNIKVGGVTANTLVNGEGAGGPITPSTREVAPQQRALLGQLTGSWREGTTSWSADVLVTANKGDSLKNTITWR